MLHVLLTESAEAQTNAMKKIRSYFLNVTSRNVTFFRVEQAIKKPIGLSSYRHSQKFVAEMGVEPMTSGL